MRTYNTYDLYGLLQGLLDALGKHVSAIPLQARVELATAFVEALPEHPDEVRIEVAPRLSPRERYKQQTGQREPQTPSTPPKLSPLGAIIAN